MLHLGPITLATFVSADMRRLLDQTMPQLNDFKIIVEPPSAVSRPVLPRIRIRPERLPALRYLHIEGAVLLCESLSQLRRLELRNPAFAPLGHTFDEFLTTLSTGQALQELVLENYMGRMDAEGSTSLHFWLAMCKTAFVKDTAQNLYRLLSHLCGIPADVNLEVFSSADIPGDLEVLPLRGLIHSRHLPVHCAIFRFTSNGVQLICSGSEHRITIEYCVASPVLVDATFSMHNVALRVLMRFLDFMHVSTLEIAGPADIVDLQAWFDLLALTPNVRELVIKQQGQGELVSDIFAALASLSGQASETPVRCPHLKDVKVHSTVYSSLLIDTIGRSARWRAEYRGPFRSLDLLLAPRLDGNSRSESASNVTRDWAAKLQANKYVDRVVVKDAINRV